MQRTMTRRGFLSGGGKAVLGAGLAGTLLTACGGESSQGGQVTFWSPLAGAEAQEYYRQNVERPFEKSNQGVDLKVTFQNSEDQDRLIRTALQGGQGPDLVQTLGPSIALEYVDAGLFAELDEYAEQGRWQDKMLGWALDTGRFEGKLYSVPTEFETMLLYYNKTLFEDKGWQPPTSREELEDLAAEAQGQGIVPFAAGIGDFPNTMEWYPTMFWNHFSGPDALYQALTGETPWTDPVFVEAIDLFKGYVERGWFGGSVEKFFSNSFDSIHAQLGEGEAAMNMEGSWFLGEIGPFFGEEAGNNNDWDWVSIPPLRNEVPHNIFELGIGATLSINRRSESPDAAAEYITWLFSSPERAAKRIAAFPNGFNIPVPLDAEDFPSSMDERVRRVYVSLTEATDEGNYGYTTWTFWPPKSNVYVYEGMQKVLVGDVTPNEFCAELDRIFKEELRAGEVPPILPREGA